MNETERIKKYYKERLQDDTVKKSNTYDLFIHHMKEEREAVYKQVINCNFKYPKNIKIMEIGAGAGANIPFFNKMGIDYKNIFANELIDERATTLKNVFPDVPLFIGDASTLNFENNFDIVFQSTVFTSILDADFKKRLAEKMWIMTKQKGIVLWYDFKYDNPKNKSVKGINKKEIKKLFPQTNKIDFYNVTLAPPIGRRFQRVYKLLNTLLPFLRTHVIAVIYK
ncbi:MAG: class I SAM-dependent methyltransferase [Bacteroidota bacterium]